MTQQVQNQGTNPQGGLFQNNNQQQQPQATQQVQQMPMSKNKTALAKMQEETVQLILDKVNAMKLSGELILPEGYNAGNALKSAWLYLQTIETKTRQKAIDVCTKESICNCLLEMCIRGEHPRKHCYFIPCGESLEFWEKYTGKYMRAKRDTEIEEVNAQVVYDGDNFIYTVDDMGRYQMVSHKTEIGNMDITRIRAAYAVVQKKNGDRYLEIMTMEQIRKAWAQGAAKGGSGAHINFSDQMCKRTVMSRACKIALDSTADGEYSSGTNSEENFMLPPDQREAQREQANRVEDADAQEVTDVEHQQQGYAKPKAIESKPQETIQMPMDSYERAAAATKPGSQAAQQAQGRSCPI